jgi:hypothetical protein
VVSAQEASSNVSGGFTFSWSADAAAATGGPLLLQSAIGPSLSLSARSLSSGQTASFTLTVCLSAAASPTCASSTLAFAVTASPLVALLGGGGGVIGETQFTLSGAASYDPDSGDSVLTYAWTCTRLAGGGACAARDGAPIALSSGAVQTVAQLAGAAAPGASYVFTLTVSDAAGARSSTATATVTVLPGALPLVALAGSAVLSGISKADPSTQLVLSTNVTVFVPGAVQTRWAVAQSVPGPLLDLDSAAVASTPATSTSMVIRAGVLSAGARYVFQLTATDAVGAVGSANASVLVSSPARDGWLDVSPASGTALSTPFALTASGWSADADELPLSYALDYLIDGASAPPVSLTGGTFMASPVFSVQLPAGQAAGNVVTLRLTVRSAFGATVSANASAVVTWPAFADAAAASAFVDDATARAEASLQGGDASAAMQLVGGLAALLNLDAAGDDGGAAAAAAAQRAQLLSIVADALSQSAGASMGAAALESTAALVSSLASSQLSNAGALAALNILGSVASAGADATVTLSVQAVSDVLATLDLCMSVIIIQDDPAAERRITIGDTRALRNWYCHRVMRRALRICGRGPPSGHLNAPCSPFAVAMAMCACEDPVELTVCALSLEALPLELVHRIFRLVLAKKRARAACVCRSWRDALADPEAWLLHFFAHHSLCCSTARITNMTTFQCHKLCEWRAARLFGRRWRR